MEPVWIDLQINGYAGVDFNSPGLTVDAVKEVVRRLAADGTAGFCPTFVTGDPEVVLPNIRTVVAARKADAECARCILGLHLEGPFISPELGAVGSHPIEWVTTPSLEKFARYQDAAEGLVRLVTVAAEIPGMPEFVRAVSEQGVVVSLGHQMAATPAEIEPCLAAGARAFTHLGNGIPNMIPRHNNILFTALAEDRATVMRLIAVSDAQYPAGLQPGHYCVSGADAVLEPDGLLWNPARNCLVGATTPMAKMMDLLQSRIGLSFADCLAIGRDNPLALLAESL